MTKKRTSKQLAGFTIVEIIVVLGIIAIIIGLGFINFQASNDSSVALSTSRDIVASDLRLAADKALLGERFQGKDPIGWGVQFDGGDNEYKIFADLDGDRIYDSNERYKSVELTQGIKVYPSYSGVTSGSVLFNTQTGKIYFNNTQLGITTAANLQINLSNSNNAESGTLEITPEGTVSDASSTIISPDSIAGLVAWYKADSLTLTDSQSVDLWPDSSTSVTNYDANQNGSARPIFYTNVVNYLPVVRFDGVNDNLALSSSISTLSTVFVVMKWAGTTNYSHILGNTGSNTPFYGDTNASGRIIHQTWAYSQVVNATVYNNGTLISSSALMRDKSNFQIITIMPTIPMFFNNIGRTASIFTQADYAEVIVYDTLLSSPDRQAVEEYLSFKYNIPLSY